MALEPATMDPLEGPFNLDELRMWVSDTRKIASGKSFQVVRLGDLFDELLFGDTEEFELLVGNILDAKKHYRFRADLTDDLSISVINLPNGKMIMGVINPVKKDAKFLINGHPVVIDAVKPTMVIGLQYKDDLDNTGRGLFIVSQASDTIEPPKILIEPQGGTFLEGDVADVIATAIGYKDVIAIKNGDVLDGIKAAALPVPILPGTSDIYVFGFVHPKDPNMIAWTKPASIRRGEAEPAQIISQSQSLEADAGTETTLFADVIGTPPPLVKWVEKINGANGPVVATGREFIIKVLNTRTFVPIAFNRYKVGLDGKFDTNGELKDFLDEGDPVTVKPILQEQDAPVVTMDDDTPQSYMTVVGATKADAKIYEGSLDVTIENPVVVPLVWDAERAVLKLVIGDLFLAENKAGVRLKETLTHSPSPWATNPDPFTTAMQPALGSLAYYSADAGVTSADGFTWLDQFGNNKNLKAEGSAIPSVIPNALNGKAVLEFANSPINSVSAIGIQAATPRMMMVLVKRTSGADSNILGIGTGQNQATPTNIFSDLAFYQGGLIYHVNGKFAKVGENIFDWQIITAVADGNGNVDVYVNDTKVSDQAPTSAMPNGATLRVGGGHYVDIQNFTGQIAEVIIRNDTSETARLKNLNYLQTKWGL